MNIRVYENYEELCRATADFVAEYVRSVPSALICFPSGDTPTGVLRNLVLDVQQSGLNISGCSFVGLDEWVGLNGHTEGSCRHYVDQHFFLPLGIPLEKIIFFDGSSRDLQAECLRIDKAISESGGIDLMMVGIGMNGHVGLNEPGVDFGLYSHLSVLSPNTKEVAKKYFIEEVPLSVGITLGPRHILEAHNLVMIASGSSKAKIAALALKGEVSQEIPASIVQLSENAFVFLDRGAASFMD